MRAPLRRLLVVAPLIGMLGLTGLAQAASPKPAKHDKPKSGAKDPGVVTLRTTDDLGRCATDRKAKRDAKGAACPTFDLYYALPKLKQPRGLVVVFHGHGHNGEQYPAQLATLAAEQGVVAVAMATAELAPSAPSYRGPFDSVDEEGRDAAVAIDWARQKFHTTKTFLLGVSMGGSGLAYFIDAATRPATGDVDATWVQSFKPLPLAGLVDAEGIASLPETWAEASGFDKVAAAEIELETGGTPTTAPAAYRARSLALLPTASWQATGLPVVAVVHDVDDGLVPYNQTFEARAAVVAARISLQTYDIVFKDNCAQEGQTTGSATITKAIPGFPTAESESALCMAGHANENDPSTPVMKAAMKALGVIIGGSVAASATVINPTHP